MKRIHSVNDNGGNMFYHYDEFSYLGCSQMNGSVGYHYGNDGSLTGYSIDSGFGVVNHFNSDNSYAGTSVSSDDTTYHYMSGYNGMSYSNDNGVDSLFY